MEGYSSNNSPARSRYTAAPAITGSRTPRDLSIVKTDAPPLCHQACMWRERALDPAVTRRSQSRTGTWVWTFCRSVAWYSAIRSTPPCWSANQLRMTMNETMNSACCWRRRLICCWAASTDTDSSDTTNLYDLWRAHFSDNRRNIRPCRRFCATHWWVSLSRPRPIRRGIIKSELPLFRITETNFKVTQGHR